MWLFSRYLVDNFVHFRLRARVFSCVCATFRKYDGMVKFINDDICTPTPSIGPLSVVAACMRAVFFIQFVPSAKRNECMYSTVNLFICRNCANSVTELASSLCHTENPQILRYWYGIMVSLPKTFCLSKISER